MSGLISYIVSSEVPNATVTVPYAYSMENTSVSTIIESINELNHEGAARLHVIIAMSILFFVIGAAGVFGNVLVIYSVLSDRKMRSSVTNLLITNLALADLFIMIFGVPEIVQFIINRGWLLGEIPCKLNRYVLVSSLYVSVLTLSAVCIER